MAKKSVVRHEYIWNRELRELGFNGQRGPP